MEEAHLPKEVPDLYFRLFLGSGEGLLVFHAFIQTFLESVTCAGCLGSLGSGNTDEERLEERTDWQGLAGKTVL